MNIFRFFGDMSHLASILVLLLKLRASKSAAGTYCKDFLGRAVGVFAQGRGRTELGDEKRFVVCSVWFFFFLLFARTFCVFSSGRVGRRQQQPQQQKS